MRAPLSPESAAIATIADERRAFIARYLLENDPLHHAGLAEKLREFFPEVAAALSPWPERSQSIADICLRSLSTTDMVAVEKIVVKGFRGWDVVANGFYKTRRANEISDVIDFAFGVSNDLDHSLFGMLGYMSGGSLTSTKNRAMFVLRLAEETKPEKLVSLASISFYDAYNGPTLAAHAQALAEQGLAVVIDGTGFECGQKKRYYWASYEAPSPELAKRVRGRPHPKFARLMDVLYNFTSRDGKRTMHHFDIAEHSGYSPDKVTITLKMLEDAGIVRSVTKYSSLEVAVTEFGVNAAEQLLMPIHLCFNGTGLQEKSHAWKQIKRKAEDFRCTGTEGLSMVMGRYACVAGNAYAK